MAETNPDKSAPKPLLTPTEVATYLDVPPKTLRVWRSKGTGPVGYRVGKHIRYDADDVFKWLEAHRDRCADEAEMDPAGTSSAVDEQSPL